MDSDRAAPSRRAVRPAGISRLCASSHAADLEHVGAAWRAHRLAASDGVDIATLHDVAAQQVALSLLQDQATTLLIITSALIINLRHLIYSASLAEASRAYPGRSAGFASYFLTDECYATLQNKILKSGKASLHFFLGAGVTLFFIWQISTVLGVTIGNRIPEWLHFSLLADFVFLAFIVRAAANLKLKVTFALAALSSALLLDMPYKLNLISGALLAVVISQSVSYLYLRSQSLKRAQT